MNPGKEEEKRGEGVDENEVAGGGSLPMSPECLIASMSPDGASLGSGLST